MLYCLYKLWKIAIFGAISFTNSMEKSEFSTFWTSCFYSLERRFFVLEYGKRHFPGLYCLKKNLQKWPLCDQKHGLTPLEKRQFFDFLYCLFFPWKGVFFVLEYRKRHFPGLYCFIKRLKNCDFWDKTMG